MKKSEVLKSALSGINAKTVTDDIPTKNYLK